MDLAATERIARTLAKAEYTFRDTEEARIWMAKPHPELGNQAPEDVARSEDGARRVEDILGAIVFGLPV
ncbi:MbcA/ParS/Xre antitoxin family protein [Edaphobacter modestus]|uniref:MbcA/ParS/Xre antitoxin family protein n=1 Tax=Edaphobacter modestus TaxID=388466 RepID=UPI00102C1158|nr:MbcA/ParS/Xre antitoxin family protein [Edaphobacter modestus]